MPQLDGYPDPDGLTGQEWMTIKQGGRVRSIQTADLLAWVQAQLGQGGGGVTPPASHTADSTTITADSTLITADAA